MEIREQSDQSFRTESSANIIAIPTRLDKKTGQRIVLWRDIQQIFKEASVVLNDGKAVVFLTDDDFEYLTPLRILHYPGAVLEVVVDNTYGSTVRHTGDEAVTVPISSQQPGTLDCAPSPSVDETLHMESSTPPVFEIPDALKDHIQASSNGTTMDSSASNAVDSTGGTEEPLPIESIRTRCLNILETVGHNEDCWSIAEDIESVSHLENPVTSNSACPPEGMLVIQSGSMTIYTQTSILAYHQLHDSYHEATKSDQVVQATAIKDAMSELVVKLQVEMNKIRYLHEQLGRTPETQHQVPDTQQSVEKQREQELAETERLHKEGQELRQRQQQIDEKQQQTIKQQQQASLDPFLSIHDRILDVITQTYELHEYPFPRLFIVLPKEVHIRDTTLKATADRFRLYFLCECGIHTESEDTNTSHEVHLTSHEGYDLVRPTEFFEKYGNYVLTLLYMVRYGITAAGLIVPPLTSFKIIEGVGTGQQHFKCLTESLVDDSIEFLQELMSGSSNGSATDMRLNKLEVLEGRDVRQVGWYLKVNKDDHGFGNLYRIVTSKCHVKWVCINHYGAKRKDLNDLNSNRIKQLCGNYKIIFKDDQSEVDFVHPGIFTNELDGCSSIQKLIITTQEKWLHFVSLTSVVIKACIVDLTVNGFSIDSHMGTLTLMPNGKLQSLRLITSINPIWDGVATIPMMRVLELQSSLEEQTESGMSFLGRILARFPNLVHLGLRLKEQLSLVKVMMVTIHKLQKLKQLDLYYGQFYATAVVSNGEIETLKIHLPPTDHEVLRDPKVASSLGDMDETLTLSHLADILQENPALGDITVGYRDVEPLDMINAIISARQWIPSEGDRRTSLRKLELISVRDHRYIPCTSIVIEFKEGGMWIDIRIGQQEETDSAMYTKVIRSYGWSIKTLDVKNKTLDDGLARLLDKSTEQNGSKLKSLGFDLRSLSLTGLQCIDRVITRSPDLESLEIFCTASDIQLERETTRWFVTRHGKAPQDYNCKLTILNC